MTVAKMRIPALEKRPIGIYIKKCKNVGMTYPEICERVRAHIKKLWNRKEESLLSHFYHNTANCLSYYGLYL